MRSTVFFWFAAALAAIAGAESIENFRMTDAQGRSWELFRLREHKAVVLGAIAGDSPESRAAAAQLSELRRKTNSLDVPVLLLDCAPKHVGNPIDAASPSVPVLRDSAQDITRELGMTRVGDVVVAIPGNDWTVAFHGNASTEAGCKVIEQVMSSIGSGQPVASIATEGGTTALPLRVLPAYDYARDVAPVLMQRCVPCHRKGGTGPFAMSDYNKARHWSEMMREVIRTGRMAPWHADPAFGKFSNDRGLLIEERQALLGWIAQGSPASPEGQDPLAAIVQETASPWALGPPDAVVQLPEEQKLPAEGTIPYRYITVPTNLEKDQWVRAFEVRPTNTAVVHHALIFVIYPKEYRHLQPEAEGGLAGFFAAFLPGAIQKPYPAGIGQFLPKGSTLIFQMHYNATGKDETDQTEMGLYFQPAPPEKALTIVGASETEFKIPPNAADSPVRASKVFDSDAELWGMLPHMHYRGSRARFDLTAPGGSRQTLLNVPYYQFDWQPFYMLDTPIPLQKGARMDVEGAFDNSKFNARNPAPNEEVQFGEQSYEEMFIGYLAVAEPRTAARYSPRPFNAAGFVGLGTKLDSSSLAGTVWHYEKQYQHGKDVFDLSLHWLGIATLGGMPATWKLQNGTVSVHMPFDDQPIPLTLAGDELFYTGTPLKRTR